jgi:hypothetical protein
VVLDPEAFLGWFSTRGHGMRGEYEEGALTVHVPGIFPTHLLESVARERKRPPERLVRLGSEIERIGFRVRDAPAELLAAWLARGLTALEAPYAALAESLEVPLVAGNPDLRRRAATVILRS